MNKAMEGAAPSKTVHFSRMLAAFVRREAALVANYRTWFAMRALTFAFTVVSLIFLARFIGASANPHMAAYGGDYLAFSLLGVLIAQLQHAAVSALSERVRTGQVAGTLEAQLATPAPTWMVVAVPPVYELCAAALRGVAFLAGAVLLLGVRFPSARMTVAVVSASLALLAFAGLGLVAGAVTMMVRRSNPIATLVGAASVLLSGVVYPASILPDWMRALGSMLPLTHALYALRRALLTGAGFSELAPSLLALSTFTAVLVPLGIGTFAYAIRRARIDGSLSQY